MNDKTGQPIRVWALLGPHRGDNNQVLALAEALRLPFEEKWLRYNQLRRLQPSLLGATLKSVAADARAQLEGDPPDLTISTGHRSVPVVRALRKRSGGTMRAVHLGYPRISPAHFDLVVPTPEYPVPDAPNVVRIPFALSPLTKTVTDPGAPSALDRLSHPRRLFVIGGPTLYWELPVPQMVAAARHLLDTTAGKGGSVLAIGSPRTPQRLLDAMAEELNQAEVPTFMAPAAGYPSYGAMIEAADEIYVTADSVAMIADAVMTRKPVGIVPITKSPLGRAAMAIADRLRPGRRLYPRDLRFFWASLREHGFGGSVNEPRASDPPDYTAKIAERIRPLLKRSARPAKAGRGSAR
ncbi:MAG TPA: ELM1/GtrOC1 family putative glycosyltransferase [Sphingomicrobium sp.]|nr:ELM1/GtrOC1 family putative glycosyltransferase [Sphingomicrobium sp.]